MISDVLLSPTVRPELADRFAVFEPLIGSWTLVVEDVADDGGVTQRDGEWHFGWALDGRALADIWISPSRAARAEGAPDGEWGMTLRFWDERIGAFRSTWHGPKRGWVIPFTATADEAGIVLLGRLPDRELSWIFSDVTPNSFSWRAEERTATTPWRVRQRFEATRGRESG